MKYLMILTIIMISGELKSPKLDSEDLKRLKVESELNQIEEKIKHLQPAYNNSEENTNKVAKAIHSSSKKYNLDWELMVTIFFKESSLRLDPQNCFKNKERCTGDYGMSQVNYRVWSRVFDIDKVKMLTDVNYSVDMGARILAHYKEKYQHRDEFWYARYHSFTPHLKQRYINGLNKIKNKMLLVASN